MSTRALTALISRMPSRPQAFAISSISLFPSQARGVYPLDYVPGTFRDKLFGRGLRLSALHPAVTYGR